MASRVRPDYTGTLAGAAAVAMTLRCQALSRLLARLRARARLRTSIDLLRLLLLPAALCAGCASTNSTSTSTSTSTAASSGTGREQLRPFTTDGCSLFPDGNTDNPQLWHDCCVRHDVAYWKGGVSAERKAADAALQRCVAETSQNEALAGLMYCGVRIGGVPWLPTSYRWAYGWPYGRGYAPLTSDEQHEAERLLPPASAAATR